jgi:hypothetical protein
VCLGREFGVDIQKRHCIVFSSVRSKKYVLRFVKNIPLVVINLVKNIPLVVLFLKENLVNIIPKINILYYPKNSFPVNMILKTPHQLLSVHYCSDYSARFPGGSSGCSGQFRKFKGGALPERLA